ncbi:MAG: DUF4143 domain-containing protein [Methylotenera sp.]
MGRDIEVLRPANANSCRLPVFTVHPWHRNVGRAIVKAPKVYFFDTGLVRGD